MAQSKKKKKKKSDEYRLPGGWKAFVVMVIVLVCLCVAVLGYELFNRYLKPYFVKEEEEVEEVEEEYQDLSGETSVDEEPEEEESETEQVYDSKINFEIITEDDYTELLFEEADNLAEMYDYDGAIACLQESGYYDSDQEMQQAVASYQAEKDACVAWTPDQVTQINFQPLIVDPSRAFDDDAMSSGYNQYMCTIDEFDAIIQTMYSEGYVMVSLHDLCTVADDGTMEQNTIYLPEGKTPFILSQDDANYYHYMDGDGFAQKLVLTEDGQVKAAYVEDDGTVSTGDYDVVPLIDSFTTEHPDFSYHGHKGTIALTGYEGVFGYRTDEVYRTKDESQMTTYQRMFFEENPDFNEEAWTNEVNEATQVADALKAEGWEFACHTWGHVDPLNDGYNAFVEDINKWIDNVKPIVGDTDIIFFAEGTDIVEDETTYSEGNEYYAFLRDKGFDIFCIVDSSQYFVQFNGSSLRIGRRSIDGYRMYYNPDSFSGLFIVEDVWDDSRPTPVPEL